MAKSVYEKFGKAVVQGATSSARRHQVRGGDTLQKIYAKYNPDDGYSSEGWRQLYEANTGVLDDPSDLHVGIVITIPSLKATET